MSTQETKQSQFGIVNKIRAFLKLDEAGRIEKFFEKEVQKAKNSIRDLKNNIAALKNIFESETLKLVDKLEDAEEALTASYSAITLENVATNDAMNSFADSYWSNIDRKEKEVEAVKQSLKALEEAHNAEIKDINTQIAKWQARIDKITEK